MIKSMDKITIISKISSSGWPEDEESFDLIEEIIYDVIENRKDINSDDLQAEIIKAILSGGERQQLSLLLALDQLVWRLENLTDQIMDSLFEIVATEKFSLEVRDNALYIILFHGEKSDSSRLGYILHNVETVTGENLSNFSDRTNKLISDLQDQYLFLELKKIISQFNTEFLSLKCNPSKIRLPSTPREAAFLFIKIRKNKWRVQFRSESQTIIVSRKNWLKYCDIYTTNLGGDNSYQEVVKETISYIISYDGKNV